MALLTKEELFFTIEKSSTTPISPKKAAIISARRTRTPSCCPISRRVCTKSNPGRTTDAGKAPKATLQQECETKAQRIHAISQLLKAYCLYQKDVQYVVQDNKVIIVDENTGRLMTGRRRWSDGLHQAVEAKEQVADRA